MTDIETMIRNAFAAGFCCGMEADDRPSEEQVDEAWEAEKATLLPPGEAPQYVADHQRLGLPPIPDRDAELDARRSFMIGQIQFARPFGASGEAASDERCANCGREFGDHVNGFCP